MKKSNLSSIRNTNEYHLIQIIKVVVLYLLLVVLVLCGANGQTLQCQPDSQPKQQRETSQPSAGRQLTGINPVPLNHPRHHLGNVCLL